MKKFCDNETVINLVNNLVTHDRTKYWKLIDILLEKILTLKN